MAEDEWPEVSFRSSKETLPGIQQEMQLLRRMRANKLPYSVDAGEPID